MSSYIVFAVDAADRFTLLAPPKAGESPEFKAVLLSWIQAPKLARRTAEGDWSVEEPCAFDAMDFVRSQIIGKQVQFTDEFVVEPLQRVSGRLTLPDGQDLSKLLLKKGFATISDKLPPKMDRKVHEEYLSLQSQGKASKAGVWAPDARQRVRQLKPFPPEDRTIIDKNLKGKTVKVRIERVQSGSGLTIMVLDYHQQLIVQFTGVQCPSIAKKDGSPDVLGLEAKFHTERSLLHRHVPMTFDGLDKFGNFLVTIGGGKGTFQEELLSRGYALYQDATAQYVTAELRDRLRQTEAKARAEKVGLHEKGDAVVSAPSAGAGPEVVTASTSAGKAALTAAQGPRRDYTGARDFDGVITQIIAGDTIVIRVDPSGEYVRTALAGVKCAKPKRSEHERDRQGGEPRTTYEDYAWEAREYLRTKFLGKPVSVHVEYGRHFEETKEVRPVATVRTTESQVNVAAALISQGFATVQIGFNDTVSCSTELFSAEDSAKAKAAGIHSGQPSQPVAVHELNRLGASKAKVYLTSLQRGMVGNRPPKWNAIVDMVMSGSGFRVYIPKEHIQFSLKLAGIISPSTGMGDEPSDPFALESKDFAIAHLQQREVQVQIETTDKGGNFIGAVYVNGKNFAEMLVEAGLATVAGADRLFYVAELQRAQKLAQEAKRCIWSPKGGVPARQAKREQQQLLSNPDAFVPIADREPISVLITEVSGGTSVWLQPQSDEAIAAYEDITAALATLGEAAPHPNPSRGENLAAYYKPDKSWLRAKVLTVDKEENSAEITYTDFGTRDWIDLKYLRQIPKNEDAFKKVRETQPLAFQAQLSFLKSMPETHEYNDAACNLIWEFSESEGITARPDFTDGSKRKYVTIVAADGTDLAHKLLESGLALTERRCAKVDAEGTKKALEKQELARKHHRQMWQFGDIDDDEDQQ